MYHTETCSEIDIARKYGDFYVWARKSYISTKGHEHHEEAREILEQTYEVTMQVFGDPYLSARFLPLAEFSFPRVLLLNKDGSRV